MRKEEIRSYRLSDILKVADKYGRCEMKYDFYGKIIRDWDSVPKHEDSEVAWADLRFAHIYKCFVEGVGDCDFRFANVMDSKFFWYHIGQIEGEGSQWENVQFLGTPINGMNMPRATFKNVIWQEGGANPSRLASINSSSFYEAEFQDCTFSEVVMWGNFFQNATFEDTVFSSCEIQKTYFRGAHFKNVVFEFCIFEEVNFEGCTFDNCKFIGNDPVNLHLKNSKTLIVVPYEWADEKIEEFVEERGLSFDDPELAVACPPKGSTVAEYVWLFNKHKKSRIILAHKLYIRRLNSDPWRELNEELAYALEKSRFPVVEMY